MRRKRPSPELSYWEIRILSALNEEGCPVCHEIAGSDRHYFFWFFNEQYSFPRTLDRMTRSLGFCLAHGTYLTRNSLDSHQLTFVHEILARRILQTLSGQLSLGPRKRRRGTALAAYDPCPPCQEREDRAASAAFFLVNLVENCGRIDDYGNPGMLCFPHLQAVSSLVSAPTLERILVLPEEAMASAINSLTEKQDDLWRTPGVDRQELLDSLLPALRLAVGHDRRLGAFPSLEEQMVLPGARDPVADFLQGLSRGDACPVCLEVRRAWIEWMRWLDDAVRQGFDVNDLLPTCAEHVWPTIHQGDKCLASVTVEKVLKDILGQLGTALRALRPSPDPGRGRPVHRLKEFLLRPRRARLMAAREILASPLRCPVCARLTEARDRALYLLFALLRDRRYRAAMESGYGLCLKHFSRALALAPAAGVREFLVELEVAKIALLLWELEEAMRKRSWSARPEPQGTEGTAWREAVRRFSGSMAGENDKKGL